MTYIEQVTFLVSLKLIVADPTAVPMWLTTFPTMFAKSACFVNPLLYFLLNKKFRIDAVRVLCRKRSNQVFDATAAMVLARFRSVEFI